MDAMRELTRDLERKKIPPFRTGDTIRVYVKIKEQDKERLQPFEGIVIRRRGTGLGKSFTVRKLSYGVGVERIFPLHSPVIDRLEVVSRGEVRKGRLYYLRGRIGKRAKVDIQVGGADWLGPKEPA